MNAVRLLLMEDILHSSTNLETKVVYRPCLVQDFSHPRYSSTQNHTQNLHAGVQRRGLTLSQAGSIVGSATPTGESHAKEHGK